MLEIIVSLHGEMEPISVVKHRQVASRFELHAHARPALFKHHIAVIPLVVAERILLACRIDFRIGSIGTIPDIQSLIGSVQIIVSADVSGHACFHLVADHNGNIVLSVLEIKRTCPPPKCLGAIVAQLSVCVSCRNVGNRGRTLIEKNIVEFQWRAGNTSTTECHHVALVLSGIGKEVARGQSLQPLHRNIEVIPSVIPWVVAQDHGITIRFSNDKRDVSDGNRMRTVFQQVVSLHGKVENVAVVNHGKVFTSRTSGRGKAHARPSDGSHLEGRISFLKTEGVHTRRGIIYIGVTPDPQEIRSLVHIVVLQRPVAEHFRHTCTCTDKHIVCTFCRIKRKLIVIVQRTRTELAGIRVRIRTDLIGVAVFVRHFEGISIILCRLTDAHPVHFHLRRHRSRYAIRVINPRKHTSYGQVEKDVEVLMEVVTRILISGNTIDSHFIVRRCMDTTLTTVHIHAHLLFRPDQGKGMVVAILQAAIFIRSMRIVRIAAVNIVSPVAGSIEILVLPTVKSVLITHLQDIHLATLRPRMGTNVLTKHPESRPETIGCIRQEDAGLKLTMGEKDLASGIDAAGSNLPASVGGSRCRENQVSPTHADPFGTIILQLVVATAAAVLLNVPVVCVELRTIEVIAPHFRPTLIGILCHRTECRHRNEKYRNKSC